MKVLICLSLKKEKSISVLPEVVNELIKCGMIPIMPIEFRDVYNDDRVVYTDSENAAAECDVLLTIGGDGAILKWGKKAAVAGKPLVGINTGRLGFMTALDCSEINRLSAIISKDYSISRRMILDAEIRGSAQLKKYSAMNDIVLFKDVNSKLPEYIVKINGIVVTKVRADGLIFSTPTGSTAYALSAGGPIIEPTVECIQLTPLCAHTLLNRPMIFNGGDVVTVSYNRYEGSLVNISIDGNSGIAFDNNEELVITKSKRCLDLIEIGEKSFYNAVSTKLMTSLK